MFKRINKYDVALRHVEDMVRVGGALEDKETTLKDLKELVDLSHEKALVCGGTPQTQWEPAESWCECPNCGEEVGFMQNYAGNSFYCPYCSQGVYIPEEDYD